MFEFAFFPDFCMLIPVFYLHKTYLNEEINLYGLSDNPECILLKKYI